MKEKTKNILRIILRVINRILQHLVKSKKEQDPTNSHPEQTGHPELDSGSEDDQSTGQSDPDPA